MQQACVLELVQLVHGSCRTHVIRVEPQPIVSEMASSRVEELDDDGNVVGAFDEAAWLDPLSPDWVYVQGDPLPTTEPSLLGPAVAAVGTAYAKVLEHGQTAILYGWVPFVLWRGMNSDPAPEGGWLSLLSLGP